VDIRFLGTGTSHGVPMIGCHCAVCRSTDPRDTRSRPSVWLGLDDGMSVLVDTATDLRSQALTNAIERVDAILYTHSHADHILGFDEVRRFNVLAGGTLPAYGDAATLEDLKRVFSYAFADTPPVGGGVPQIELREVVEPFALGQSTCVPVPIWHGPRPILGYRVGGFAYLTDCSKIPEPSFALLTNLDVLVLSALRHRPHPTHFSLDEATAAADRIGARRTYLTHMCHDLGHASTNARLPSGVELAYDGLLLQVRDSRG
jgi:phosphoribosyl 1,2-cyclic phosphate phosphodiesterase